MAGGKGEEREGQKPRKRFPTEHWPRLPATPAAWVSFRGKLPAPPLPSASSDSWDAGLLSAWYPISYRARPLFIKYHELLPIQKGELGSASRWFD